MGFSSEMVFKIKNINMKTDFCRDERSKMMSDEHPYNVSIYIINYIEI